MATISTEIRRLAGLELNALRAADTLKEQDFENIRVPATGTPIYDLNGEILFYRVPLTRGRTQVAYADFAATDALGASLLAVSQGIEWNEAAIIEQATAAAKKAVRSLKFDSARIVAYSYPKVAVQFLLGKEEALMVEWLTWAVVPPAKKTDRKPMEPSEFERWSLLDELSAAMKRANVKRFAERAAEWNSPSLAKIDSAVISKAKVIDSLVFKLVETYEVHYSPGADHVPCFELRGQETNVWCVGASVQMLLLFYRYNYTQTRLAQELGLGTKANPNGLPYGQEQKVVNTIEKLTSNALDSSMFANPSWTTHYNHLKANRPMISFIPGHSRCVAGFTRHLLAPVGSTPFRGLLVYDPWPPNAGVITRWENFDAATYRYAFSAVLKHV